MNLPPVRQQWDNVNQVSKVHVVDKQITMMPNRHLRIRRTPQSYWEETASQTPSPVYRQTCIGNPNEDFNCKINLPNNFNVHVTYP